MNVFFVDIVNVIELWGYEFFIFLIDMFCVMKIILILIYLLLFWIDLFYFLCIILIFKLIYKVVDWIVCLVRINIDIKLY